MEVTARQALLESAKNIEKYPHLFDFCAVDVANPGCGTPGCALGWIAAAVGMTGRSEWSHGPFHEDGPVYKTLGIKGESGAIGGAADVFYSRMDEISKELHGYKEWRNSAKHCAETMRKYADVHHPEEVPTPEPIQHAGLPDKVRSIFQPVIAATTAIALCLLALPLGSF